MALLIYKKKIFLFLCKGLEEFCQLLRPFARALTFVGGDQYPTLSMMYPTVRHLFKNLDQMENELTNVDVIEMHKNLRESIISRWSDPEMVGWLASFLDSRFKELSAASPTTQREVLWELREKIELSNYTNNLPTTNKAPDTEMSSFFDDEIEFLSSSQLILKFKFISQFCKSLNMIWKTHIMKNIIP